MFSKSSNSNGGISKRCFTRYWLCFCQYWGQYQRYGSNCGHRCRQCRRTTISSVGGILVGVASGTTSAKGGGDARDALIEDAAVLVQATSGTTATEGVAAKPQLPPKWELNLVNQSVKGATEPAVCAKVVFAVNILMAEIYRVLN